MSETDAGRTTVSEGVAAAGDGAVIRRATAVDIPELDRLLRQVLEVHHAGRPDLFKGGAKKYTDDQLRAIVTDEATPVFVMARAGESAAVGADANGIAAVGTGNVGTDAAGIDATGAGAPAPDRILGYAFCQFQRHPHDNILTDILTLYVDDICVDEAERGHGVGSALYRHALAFARESGCHNLTLNVWSCNPGAQAFYERMGLIPYRIGMEQLL
ncbi:GNAT family N-acetyltransferase [Bifidobacterium pullorum subsp. saeculare]|uniref:GNAT family N-acetyltransferase n=1 Tax=Bifidobacterium pullorum subsp. saeculare TaxID=78257 RepID=A0A938WXG7_9BIFI|nr:GNAT family N-acetyltransferase [Bifidobacterium pullorum subsp. saeculare]